jgi:hypothetical protein
VVIDREEVVLVEPKLPGSEGRGQFKLPNHTIADYVFSLPEHTPGYGEYKLAEPCPSQEGIGSAQDILLGIVALWNVPMRT